MRPATSAYQFDDDMAYFVHWYSVFKPADDDIIDAEVKEKK